MQKASRGAVKLLAAVGIVALTLPFAASLQAAAGREFSRCIQTCNEIRKNCDDTAIAACLVSFPNDKPARKACEAAGKLQCGIESDDCKLVCQAIKDDETPEVP